MEAIYSNAAGHLAHFGTEATVLSLVIFASVALWVAFATKAVQPPAFARPYLQFAYNNFIKPHDAKVGDGQQSALESFYGKQVGLHTRIVDDPVFQLSSL